MILNQITQNKEFRENSDGMLPNGLL